MVDGHLCQCKESLYFGRDKKQVSVYTAEELKAKAKKAKAPKAVKTEKKAEKAPAKKTTTTKKEKVESK